MSLAALRAIKINPEKPLLCMEVNPPRGVNVEDAFSRLSGNTKGIDLFNVTDSALARMKLAGLPFGAMLKQRLGIDAAVNVACRDRNLLALQSDLLAAWAMGVRSVVALTGDAMTIGDSPERKGVFEVNSIGLLNVIKTLNSGKDLAGNDLNGRPDFFPGVVVNPNVRNPAAEIRRLVKKRDAGAQYALSQPVFDPEVSTQFFTAAKDCGVPIVMGLLPWKTGKAAMNMSKIPGIRLPESLLAEVAARGDADMAEFAIEHCLSLAKANRQLVAGFHVVSGATPKLALQLAGVIAQNIEAGKL
jgi:5,10-methylenetetrahydrofolate reductase